MGTLFSYSLAASIAIVLLYPLLHRMVNRWATFRFNRFALLSAMTLAIILPMLIIPDKELDINSLTENGSMVVLLQTVDDRPAFTISSLISSCIFIYSAVALLLLVREAVSYIRLIRLLKRSKKTVHPGYVECTPSDKSMSPFSWGKFIILPHDNHNKAILIHELAHKSNRHWLDIIIADFFCIFMWYNPFVWLVKNLIRQNHEYQADEAVITSGVDVSEYQHLIISNALGKHFVHISNSFSPGIHGLRKRVTAMNRLRISHHRKRALALALPCIAAVAAFLAMPASADIIHTLSGFGFSLPDIHSKGMTYIADVYDTDSGNIISSEEITVESPQHATGDSSQNYEISLLSAGSDCIHDKISLRINFNQDGNLIDASITNDSKTTVVADRSSNRVTIVSPTSSNRSLRIILSIRPHSSLK